MTVKEALEKGKIELKTNNIEEPILKSRILMQFVLEKDRQYLMVYENKQITKQQEEKYFKAIKSLIKGTPLQHITQNQEFMKMNFFVNSKVLIPRPDTETLVEEVIKIAKKINAKRILDLCTGSGAIAVSLAKYIEKSEITGIDISNEALNIAKLNAKSNNVEEKITFIESNLFEKLSHIKYDIIVSNPPYIPKDDIKNLSNEVQKEPTIALDGGLDGLDFYRNIIQQAHSFLENQGYLCLEIGYNQKKAVIDLINKEGKYKQTYAKQDLCGNDRIIITKI